MGSLFRNRRLPTVRAPSRLKLPFKQMLQKHFHSASDFMLLAAPHAFHLLGEIVPVERGGIAFTPSSKSFTNMTSDQRADFTGQRVAVLVSGGIGAGILGWLVKRDVAPSHEGSELIETNV